MEIVANLDFSTFSEEKYNFGDLNLAKKKITEI